MPFWRSDVVSWISGFGVGDLAEKERKTREKQTKRSKKYIAYRGLILFYHMGKGPLGGTLAIFFLTFWTWWEIQWTAKNKFKKNLVSILGLDLSIPSFFANQNGRMRIIWNSDPALMIFLLGIVTIFYISSMFILSPIYHWPCWSSTLRGSKA